LRSARAKTPDSTGKITLVKKSKKGWGMAQVVQHLPHKCKALSSNPSEGERERRSETQREAGHVETEKFELYLHKPRDSRS
jgi:hypothetical protein